MLDALPLPQVLAVRDAELVLRRATEGDLPALIALLSDDPISAARGDQASPADEAAYRDGLRGVLADAANDLVVAVGSDDEPVGMLQLTRIPGLARRGATRLLVEAVRVRSSERSRGVGAAMMRWVADAAAPALGADLVQLTSDRARVDAHRFYERLGYAPSHLGFKLPVR